MVSKIVPSDVLHYLIRKFLLINLTYNQMKLCSQLEEAHWYYLDYYVREDKRCVNCDLFEFMQQVFPRIPSLKLKVSRIPSILKGWREYKKTIPTYGAIILSKNLSHVLLVESYWVPKRWGFPKGKINDFEGPADCAVREVAEEIGFDIKPYLNSNEYLEAAINHRSSRLYIIKNVPRQTKFQTRSRCEINGFKWFQVNHLPEDEDDATAFENLGLESKSLFLVTPFVKKIKQICNSTELGKRLDISR